MGDHSKSDQGVKKSKEDDQTWILSVSQFQNCGMNCIEFWKWKWLNFEKIKKYENL